jgi:SAM-dependent methyltransferase
MIFGFPLQLISELCCTHDGAALQLRQNCQLSADGAFVRHGRLVCTDCSAAFAIDDGILNMLHGISLDAESQHEQQLRDGHAKSMKATGPAWYENEHNYEHNLMEMIPTMEALSANQDKTILELGCGDGRYTVALAGQCQWILAVDFSIESLRILQQRLQSPQNVGLILGDVTTMKVCAAHFDRVFSTLVSNLPTPEHRHAMYRLAAHALKRDGRFVFSTHHHGCKQKLSGERKLGRYIEGGIYRYNFTVGECKAEVRQYFKVVEARPIQIYFPFARRLRLPLVAQSRFFERIPLLNGLGGLVLCTAEQQVRVN